MSGRITKLVTSYGATWGRVRPHGESRQLFFNLESLAQPARFQEMREGLEVEFEEQPDRANGSRAVRLALQPTAGREISLSRRAGNGEYAKLDAVSRLALEWQNSGMKAPAPASNQLPRCGMPGCSGMSYVQLKTVQGYRSLCFQHFSSVKDDAEQSKRESGRRE